MSPFEIATIILQTLGVIAIAAAAWQILELRTTRHRELENMYVQRYWSLIDRFPAEIWASRGDFQTMTNKERRLIFAYLQLCEDEIDTRRNGYITSKTWRIWAAGMRALTDLPAMKNALESPESPALPQLRHLLSSDRPFDPLELSPRGRFLAGLGK